MIIFLVIKKGEGGGTMNKSLTVGPLPLQFDRTMADWFAAARAHLSHLPNSATVLACFTRKVNIAI